MFASALLGDERRVAGGTHPDLFSLEALGEMIRIDEVRALHRDLHMRPYEAERRVYVIADAHLLNEDAADALLKDLEEPPSYAVIVLVADDSPDPGDDPVALPARPVPADPGARGECVPRRTRAGSLRDRVASLARVSGGRLDRAERLLDPAARGRRDELLRMARAPYAEPELDPATAAAALLDASQAVGAAARERAEAEFGGVELTARESEQRLRRIQRGAEREELLASLEAASWYRDLVVVAAGAEQAAVHADRLDVLREDATRERASDAETAAELTRDSWRALEEFNLNPALALEALFVQLRRTFSSVLIV